jgi:hypothetical protein
MEHLKRMKEKLHKELKEFDKKDDLSMGDVTTIHMLTDTIKNIDKICMLEEEGGYSQAVDMDRRMMPHYNQGGRSYTDGGYSQKRDSRGRYSRAAEDKNRIIRDIEKMTEQFTDEEWDMLEGFVHRIREAS